MKTRAAILFPGAGRFSVESVDLAEPREREVLVRITAAGVCHSDWNLVTGSTPHPLPVVGGHEGAGRVEALGPGVTDLAIGQHVALSWAPSCGACRYCQSGRPGLCAVNHKPIWAGGLLDGTSRLSCAGETIHHYCGLSCFADHVVVPRDSCVPMPEDLPLGVSALIGCAVTTGLGATIHSAKVTSESSVLVYGLGGVGLAVVMGAALAGAGRIVGVDRLRHRVDASRTFGVTEPKRMTQGWVPEVDTFDFVFDTTGNTSVVESCIDATRPGGTCVLIGLPNVEESAVFRVSELVRNEKRIFGSYYGSANPPDDFPRIARWHLEGKLPIDRLISRTYRLEEINDAYDDMLGGRTLRGVIDMTR